MNSVQAITSAPGVNTPKLLVSAALVLCLVFTFVAAGLLMSSGAVLFMLLAAVAFSYPDRMLLAALSTSILIPIEIAFQQEPFPRIGPTRIVVAALIVGVLLNWCFKRGMTRVQLGDLPLFSFILLYALTVVVSTLFSIAPRQSYFAASLTLIEQFVLFYFFVHYLGQPGFWRRLRKTLFATTAVVCMFALVEEVVRFNPLGSYFNVQDDLYRGGLLRVSATFYHPIALGCFIGLVIPFVFMALVRETDRRKRLCLTALLFMMLIVSFFTVSRGPWLAITLEVCVVAVWWAWRNLYRIALLSIIVALIIAGSLFFMESNYDSGHNMKTVLNPNQVSLRRLDEASSEYYRVALLKAVLERLEGRRWVYGFGPGTFYLAGVESKYARVEHVLTAGDNHYALLLLEVGLAGLVAFFFLLGGSLWICLRAVRNSTRLNQSLAIACLASVIGFACNNVTVSMFGLLPLNMLFWAIVAVAFRLTKPCRSGLQASALTAHADCP